MSAPSIKGWCPGALRPMLSGDGYLVRLRIAGGVVSATAARAIADCAQSYGNGLLDLSARANLQLRGVTQARLPALVEALRGHGLIDESTEAESVRNVLASPLAGLASDAAFDIGPHVRALEQRLVSDAALHALPSKFGFIIDDGGSLSLSCVGADIRFLALHEEAQPLFMVSLAGCDEAAVIEASVLPDVAARLALSFINEARQCETPPRRMSALTAAKGADALWRAAGLVPKLKSPRAATTPQHLGHHPLGASGFLGLGFAFGRVTAGDLAWLAAMAQAHGSGELRLTPWRAILLPGFDANAAQKVLSQASAAIIADPCDARLSVIACPGAPACASATTPTQDDALALAPLARALSPVGVALHVSGCAKGCARPIPSAVTLVARAGLYDLVTQGRASDAPALQGLDRNACAAALRAMVQTKERAVERL
jgi:precorrin-3B synthase